MRILLTGSKGMLGQDFVAYAAPRHEIMPLSRPEVDITDGAAVGRYFTSTKPEAVVHAAAFTAVDECERRPETAFAVNADGTRNVAQAARDAGFPMLYISTDYVFDGKKTEPYVEEDVPHPLGIYGKSKLEGEKAVRDLVSQFWIVRTSWLFGPHGRNFVRTILERAKAGERLRVVDDQVGSPTYTMHLAAALDQVVTRGAGRRGPRTRGSPALNCRASELVCFHPGRKGFEVILSANLWSETVSDPRS